MDDDPKKPHKLTCQPGPLWNPQMPEAGKDGHFDPGFARRLTITEMADHSRSARQPLAVGHGVDYATVPWPAKLRRPAPDEHKLFQSAPFPNPNVPQAAAGMLVPPMIFSFVSWVLTFSQHYKYGRLAWVFALCGLVPLALVISARQKARGRGRRNPWHMYYILMFAVSWIVAAVVSEVNYFYFMHPFYELQAMRTYTNINPTETSGMRVMDAASVGFVDGTRVATDMAMSYTASDVYCVAPISTAVGLPSQAGKLSSYDFWAVGVNCCKSGRTDGFNCGQLNNPRARMGLRLVDNDQLSYFRLAVQQAEAAYNINARHPVFFYWTEEPDKQLVHFFGQGFRNWVMAGTAHFAISFLVLAMFIVIPRDFEEEDIETSLLNEDEKMCRLKATRRYDQHNAQRASIIDQERDRQHAHHDQQDGSQNGANGHYGADVPEDGHYGQQN